MVLWLLLKVDCRSRAHRASASAHCNALSITILKKIAAHCNAFVGFTLHCDHPCLPLASAVQSIKCPLAGHRNHIETIFTQRWHLALFFSSASLSTLQPAILTFIGDNISWCKVCGKKNALEKCIGAVGGTCRC